MSSCVRVREHNRFLNEPTLSNTRKVSYCVRAYTRLYRGVYIYYARIYYIHRAQSFYWLTHCCSRVFNVSSRNMSKTCDDDAKYLFCFRVILIRRTHWWKSRRTWRTRSSCTDHSCDEVCIKCLCSVGRIYSAVSVSVWFTR